MFLESRLLKCFLASAAPIALATHQASAQTTLPDLVGITATNFSEAWGFNADGSVAGEQHFGILRMLENLK